MSRVLEMAHQVANTVANVLITGETGVGKEVIANFIHSVVSQINVQIFAD